MAPTRFTLIFGVELALVVSKGEVTVSFTLQWWANNPQPRAQAEIQGMGIITLATQVGEH